MATLKSLDSRFKRSLKHFLYRALEHCYTSSKTGFCLGQCFRVHSSKKCLGTALNKVCLLSGVKAACRIQQSIFLSSRLTEAMFSDAQWISMGKKASFFGLLTFWREPFPKDWATGCWQADRAQAFPDCPGWLGSTCQTAKLNSANKLDMLRRSDGICRDNKCQTVTLCSLNRSRSPGKDRKKEGGARKSSFACGHKQSHIYIYIYIYINTL